MGWIVSSFGVWIFSGLVPEGVAKGSGFGGRALFAFGEGFGWKHDVSDSCEIVRKRPET